MKLKEYIGMLNSEIAMHNDKLQEPVVEYSDKYDK